MKKVLLSFTMLASIAASAQKVNINVININYSQKIITCDLSWTGRDATHLSNVWVYVDYIEVSGNTTSGSWQRAPITGATVTKNIVGTATAITIPGNTLGIWVKGTNTTADFTGQITLQLDNAVSLPSKFDACVYASDYPPNMSYKDGNFIFKGTPPFTLKSTSGTVTQIVQGNILPATSFTFVPVILTDITGCPGIVNWIGYDLTPFDLGIVSFVSTTTYKIGTQIWSSPVQATGCGNSFNGGSADDYKADCRDNTNAAYGDLFSWIAVLMYADRLCPSPWRVPTVSDYCELHKVLNGASDCSNLSNKQTYVENFINYWGGATWGFCDRTGTMFEENRTVALHTLTGTESGKNIYNFSYSTNEWSVHIAHLNVAENGFTLRCVQP
jgi:uncharacterized protein (TIGR02145 family)